MHEDKSVEKPTQDGDQDIIKNTVHPNAEAKRVCRDGEEVDPFDEAADTLVDLLSESGNLPDFSSALRLVLTPVDPTHAHVYWENSPEVDESENTAAEGVSALQCFLRVHEIGDIVRAEDRTQEFLDIAVDLSSDSRFLSSLKPGASYFAELGFKGSEGRFFSLAQSNEATMPIASPLQKGDESYMLVSPEYEIVRILPSPGSIASSKIIALASRFSKGFKAHDTELENHAGTRTPLQGTEGLESVAHLELLMKELAQFFELKALYELDLETQLSARARQTKPAELDLTEKSERSFAAGGTVSS